MIIITQKDRCCGCTACASICPQGCINMQPDEEHFLYPVVDKAMCIQCGMCEMVCPILSGYVKETVKSSYVVRHKDNDILNASTSGGAFSTFAQDTLRRGGVVFGVGFSEAFQVVHIEVEGDAKKLQALRGSKYVQSDLKDAFKRVKAYLHQGRPVLFSGTSCQVAGLHNYLQHSYDQLLTVEVICRATPSPFLWNCYLQQQIKKYGGKPQSIAFRNKTYGYHSGTMEITFQNGKRYRGSGRVDEMLKSFYSDIASRPSCYRCVYKGMDRPSDISIYDCWHADALVGNLQDDDRGYTNVMINTKAGEAAFSRVSVMMESYPVNTAKAVALDGVMVLQQPPNPPQREQFYQLLASEGLSKTVARLIPISKKDLYIEASKSLLYRLGLLSRLKKMKRER
jgi:coenzyme F420-reducing hydrogenase beta subunit